MTDAHEEVLTLHVEVQIPAHADRVETAVYRETRPKLLEREGGRCWSCGRTEKELGKPLQTHHHPIERSFANMIDWPRFIVDAKAGIWGLHVQAFDWDSFNPDAPWSFVDDMTVNGRVLCEEHHIGADAGIHAIPYPMVIAEKYGKDGYQFSPTETLEHNQQQQGLASK